MNCLKMFLFYFKNYFKILVLTKWAEISFDDIEHISTYSHS
jgi:hypothetical protein